MSWSELQTLLVPRATVAALSCVLLSACGSENPASPAQPALPQVSDDGGGGGVAALDEPAEDKAAARFEKAFLKGMIDHHFMAVQTSELCLTRAVHEELRNLCSSIRSSQMEEIETMQGWLADWYGVSYQPRMDPAGESKMERLAALSGEEFEIRFMQMMIKHHSKAIQEGERCVEQAEHRALIEMCHDIIRVQSEEIALMESWLCAWYGLC
jgi:uncharacterized protein (DUF305 family)